MRTLLVFMTLMLSSLAQAQSSPRIVTVWTSAQIAELAQVGRVSKPLYVLEDLYGPYALFEDLRDVDLSGAPPSEVADAVRAFGQLVMRGLRVATGRSLGLGERGGRSPVANALASLAQGFDQPTDPADGTSTIPTLNTLRALETRYPDTQIQASVQQAWESIAEEMGRNLQIAGPINPVTSARTMRVLKFIDRAESRIALVEAAEHSPENSLKAAELLFRQAYAKNPGATALACANLL